jgi:hypothetical protein
MLIWKGVVKKGDPEGEAEASSTMHPADIRWLSLVRLRAS